jgi:hypothetical protein
MVLTTTMVLEMLPDEESWIEGSLPKEPQSEVSLWNFMAPESVTQN